MAYNGSGTFLINTAGQPVVAGTVISSTTFNSLTADLATGLSTVITKDGQTTVTANIPMASFKFTGLGVGSAAGDSANLSQVQSTVTKLLASVSGADTVTATASPTLAAYAAGQMFYFVAAGDNTTSVTLNIDALGAKAVTRDGSVALAAADIKSGEVVVVVYDGTRFQVVSQLNSAGNATFANVSITSALNVGGVATFSAGSAAAPSITTTGDTNTGIFFPAADTIAFTEGGVESMRINSSGNLGLGVTPSAWGTSGTILKALQIGAAGSVAAGTVDPSIHISQNAYFDGTNWNRIDTGSAAGNYYISGNTHNWRIAASGANPITFTQAMTLNSSGNLGLGTSTIPAVGSTTVLAVGNANGGTQAIVQSGSVVYRTSASTSGVDCFNPNASPITWYTNGTGRMVLDASGNLDLGTTGGSDHYQNIIATSAKLTFNAGTGFTGSAATSIYNQSAIPMIFGTNTAERCRITSGGDLLVGKTSDTTNGAGFTAAASGYIRVVRSSDAVGVFNRATNDGTIIEFQQDAATEGTISVSGNTVSYNAFAGSHWSQLQDGSKPDILRGTVMESINELCVWPDEQNERLPKSKVSDTAGSKKVYGVFMAWDNDWATTNDMYVTAVGAFICRVNASVTVQEGDLLESNGDGTARVQADDIIRSSTIGKVTSTVKTHQYADGSYCVPTVLYCG